MFFFFLCDKKIPPVVCAVKGQRPERATAMETTKASVWDGRYLAVTGSGDQQFFISSNNQIKQ